MEKKVTDEEEVIVDDFFIVSREIDTLKLKPSDRENEEPNG